MDFLKAELVGKNKWRVLSIPYGGPDGGKCGVAAADSRTAAVGK